MQDDHSGRWPGQLQIVWVGVRYIIISLPPSPTIVGLSGSTPNANPAIGNPRGIGVQLSHDGGIHGSGKVYISPTANDPNRQVYLRTPAQGTDTPVGVTHVLPLRARVIRTSPAGAPISPGPFNTSVIVVIQYP